MRGRATGEHARRSEALLGASAATLTTTLTTATATAAPEAAAFAGRAVSAALGGWALRRGARFGRGALGAFGAFGTRRPVGAGSAFRTFATRRTRRTVRSLRTLSSRRTVALRRTFDIRLRLLLRRAALGRHRTADAAASAASSAAFRLLLFRTQPRTLLRGTLLLWRTRSLLRLWRTLLLLLLLRALPVTAALLLALLLTPAASTPRLVAIATALLFAGAARFAGPLLELADLLLHIAARLRVLAGAQLVVAAVGAATPSLGISSLAARAENGFRERHRKSARIVHFGLWMKTAAARCWR